MEAKRARCNCENLACTDHKRAPCPRPANPTKRAMYVGALCDECAARMPAKYMLTSPTKHATNCAGWTGRNCDCKWPLTS